MSCDGAHADGSAYENGGFVIVNKVDEFSGGCHVLGSEVGDLPRNNTVGTGGLGEFEGELRAVLLGDEFEGFDDECISG